MAKKKIKINEKWLENAGLEVDLDSIPNKVVKRIHFDGVVSEGDAHEGDTNYSVGTISTIDVDADGDVVLPEGMDTRRYEKNPVVLFNHSLSMPIGYAEKIVVSDEKIVAKTRYGTTAEAYKVHQLVKDKVLRTHSIGFLTLEELQRGTPAFNNKMSELKKKFPQKFTDENAKMVDRIVTKAVMVEYSIVTIPANEDAVIAEVKSAKNSIDKVEKKQSTSSDDQNPVDKAKEILSKKKGELSTKKSETDEKKEKFSKVTLVRRAPSIKLIATKEELETKKLQEIYLRLWGV